MPIEVIVALVTGLCSVIAVAITNAKFGRDMDAKLDKQQAVFEAHITEQINGVKADVRRLEQKQDKHNEVINRTYELEKRADLQEAEIERHKQRIKELEKRGD